MMDYTAAHVEVSQAHNIHHTLLSTSVHNGKLLFFLNNEFNTKTFSDAV